MPAKLVEGVMVMIHKKGDCDDKWNYRPVCLLSQAYKLLSCLILKRLTPYMEQWIMDE